MNVRFIGGPWDDEVRYVRDSMRTVRVAQPTAVYVYEIFKVGRNYYALEQGTGEVVTSVTLAPWHVAELSDRVIPRTVMYYQQEDPESGNIELTLSGLALKLETLK